MSAKLPADARSILTRDEVADMLRVSARTVERLEAQRLLRSFRVGRAVRFDARDVDAYIASQRGGAS